NTTPRRKHDWDFLYAASRAAITAVANPSVEDSPRRGCGPDKALRVLAQDGDVEIADQRRELRPRPHRPHIGEEREVAPQIAARMPLDRIVFWVFACKGRTQDPTHMVAHRDPFGRQGRVPILVSLPPDRIRGQGKIEAGASGGGLQQADLAAVIS